MGSKTNVKKAWRKSVFKSSIVSIAFTIIVLFLLNFEAIDNQAEVLLIKNIIMAIFIFMSSFVMIHSNFVISSFQERIEKRDDYISELKEIIDGKNEEPKGD